MAERPVVLRLNVGEPMMLWYLKDHPTAFDPETISILSGALDDAWQVVEANKAAFRMDGDTEGARNALASGVPRAGVFRREKG
jgi:hypothetical protein